MNKFIWETGQLQPVAAKRPRTARDLVKVLGVENASLKKKQEAVDLWLQTHHADAVLTASLKSQGLAPPPKQTVNLAKPIWASFMSIEGVHSATFFIMTESDWPEPKPVATQPLPAGAKLVGAN